MLPFAPISTMQFDRNEYFKGSLTSEGDPQLPQVSVDNRCRNKIMSGENDCGRDYADNRAAATSGNC